MFALLIAAGLGLFGHPRPIPAVSPGPVIPPQLQVAQVRACREARMSLGVPLEAPAGTLSPIVRIDVLSSLRLVRPLGLLYTLQNGREFFSVVAARDTDASVLNAANDFLTRATFDLDPQPLDRASAGYSLQPVTVDGRQFAKLDLDRRNCVSLRVL